ncbi:MAG TPA: 16S rRNA (adenine(1518)-N(6)/adenine(1519)-N(6))-dimethyltransferase RsmA [Candidatus Limnocylindria bacterium]|nr:16S rRNA (adenine(1518)-N(6)/adenine(1519)-N(6))-dimethyltransferase RsmA [Candidatus Limnocylindria bacterium]
MDIADPRALQTVLRRHGVRAATSLGQRFLVDHGVLDAIVEAAELSAEDDVLEVGPGPGVLTARLAERARSVTAVEIDERMIAVLRDTLSAHENVTIVRADALEVDLFALAERRPTRIVANVPYQITTPLLERFIGDGRRPPLIVVLVQEEVATRIAATASSGKERGYLSVFVQSFAEARIVRRVPARAFRPAPKVGSALVALRTHSRPAFEPLEQHAFLRFVSDVFRHRRKQLRGALGHEAGVTPDRAESALRACGIDPKRRAEELTLAEWVALARVIGVPTDPLSVPSDNASEPQ